jgi:DNA repair exonuclease SbcCD nuclease subunit
MRVLVTGDLHFSDNPRDQYRHDFVAQFCKLVTQYKADGVIILGDLTELKDRHSAVLVNQVVSHIHSIAKLCPVIILPGNHDGPTPLNPFFRFAERISGITWVSTPIEGKNVPIPLKMGLNRSLFLPYSANYKEDWADMCFSGYDWIFAHQTFHGADVGFGKKLDGIPLSLFPKDAKVISGDIHVPQKLGQVTYVGSPYSVDFGDDFEPRILLLENNRARSIPCDGVQKRLVNVQSLKALHEYRGLTKGDILKIKIRVTQQEKWPEVRQAARAWGDKNGYWVYSVIPVMDQAQKAKSDVRGQSVRKSDRDLVQEFARARGLSERVVKTALFLMERV